MGLNSDNIVEAKVCLHHNGRNGLSEELNTFLKLIESFNMYLLNTKQYNLNAYSSTKLYTKFNVLSTPGSAPSSCCRSALRPQYSLPIAYCLGSYSHFFVHNSICL